MGVREAGGVWGSEKEGEGGRDRERTEGNEGEGAEGGFKETAFNGEVMQRKGGDGLRGACGSWRGRGRDEGC